MTPYIEQNLLKNEKILKTTKLSIAALFFWPGLFFWAFVILPGLAGASVGWGWFVFIVWSLSAIGRYIGTEIAVTNKRIIVKHGVVTTKTTEIQLQKIESVNAVQTFYGKIFNFGSLVFNGTGGGLAPLKKISKPFDFRKAVLDAIEGA